MVKVDFHHFLFKSLKGGGGRKVKSVDGELDLGLEVDWGRE
jgi:hypothetical protein